MTFEENLRIMQRDLRYAGYSSILKPVNIGVLDKEDAVQNCKIIASKDQYNILYMEAESNWKGIATNVAKNQKNPCLVITSYKDTYIILSTIKGIVTTKSKPRHLVIDQKSKTHSMQNFIKLIKTEINDDIVLINDKVQNAFDEFSEYKEALDDFAENLEVIIKNTESMINKAISGNSKYHDKAEKFLKICQKIINKDMKMDDIKSMLIQHILTYRIFAMAYDERDFHSKNTVAKQLESLKKLLKLPDNSINYQAIELVAESITDSDQQQEFLKKLYETFYAKYDPAKADKDGIVYTPIQVVSFIVLSVEYILKKHFRKKLSDNDVKILDPFTGTGTFLVHALRQIDLDRLEYKYSNEILAGEISILPYYIAALNIENTYKEMNGKYKEFENICWIDTFASGSKNYEDLKTYIQGNDNIERIMKQQDASIFTIITNPPYRSGQDDFNDKNPNSRHREIDDRIEATFGRGVTGKSKEKLHDSYIRSIRWMADRIKKSGIIGIVTNASFLRSYATSGMRATLAEEFDEIWCLDLRGNQRTKGEESRKEGGKIFGAGSRAPVAITFLIKKQKKLKKNNAKIYYKDIGDYHDRQKKLCMINEWKSIDGIVDWDHIMPDKFHDWLDQRNDDFYRYDPLGSKSTKSGKNEKAIFSVYSQGVLTARDKWTYNTSKSVLSNNMKNCMKYANSKISECGSLKKTNTPKLDRRKVKWSPILSWRLIKHGRQKFDANKCRMALYRPLFKQWLYYDKIFNEAWSRTEKFFPKNNSKNLIICVPTVFSGNFYTYVTNIMPDYETVHHGQYFPLYTYYNQVRENNILNSTLDEYREHYNDKKIVKTNIFYYVYGLLHHDGYRKKFKNNLNRELPHIPMAPNFWEFSNVGKKLADLHISFETCKKHDLGNSKFKITHFKKLSFGNKKGTVGGKEKLTKDISVLRADGKILFENIPNITYTVNDRTPLEWIVDRYQITMDKASGIMNDPCTGTDIIAVIERAIYLGLESDKLIASLPKEFEPKSWEPRKTGLDQFTDSKSAQTMV